MVFDPQHDGINATINGLVHDRVTGLPRLDQIGLHGHPALPGNPLSAR